VSLSEGAKALWAKSDRDKDKGFWHPLIAHLLDVARGGAGHRDPNLAKMRRQ